MWQICCWQGRLCAVGKSRSALRSARRAPAWFASYSPKAWYYRLGAALGALLAHWGTRVLPAFLTTFHSRVSRDLTVDLRVLIFTIGVALGSGLLFGLAPAWRGTSTEPQAAIKANARGIAEGHSRFNLGKWLVILQIALSLASWSAQV